MCSHDWATPPLRRVPGNPEEAVANQPRGVLVALVEDLDGHGAVLDLPADPAVLPDLAPTALGSGRALMHDPPHFLGGRIHVERVAMFLHQVLLRAVRFRARYSSPS